MPETPPRQAPNDSSDHGVRTHLWSLPLISSFAAFVGAGAAILLIHPASPWMFVPQAVLLLTVTYLIATGANWLVDAACRLALRMGVSYLIIGLTVVAMGTSAPELAASLLAGFQGRGDITVANVIGSNIFNICFILGGAAILAGGIHVERGLLVRDGPVLLTVTLVLFLFVGRAPLIDEGQTGPLLDLRLARFEGIVLLSALALYLYALYRVMRRAQRRQAEGDTAAEAIPDAPIGDLDELPDQELVGQSSTGADVAWLVIGTILVVGGSHVLVGHAERIGDTVVQGFGALWFARVFEIPDYIIGVTVVAAGTSAPEFVISLVAALRGAFGMSAGNLIGSDLFNMLGVLGISGIVLQPPLAPPITLSAAVVPSLLALSAVVALMVVFMWTGRRISRLEGAILVLLGAVRWGMDFAFLGAM